MGIAAAIAPLIGGVAQGLGGLFGGNSKADAAKQAADAQVAAQQQGLNSIQGIMGTQQANANPFIDAGHDSLKTLMTALQNGTFGIGSAGTVPAYTGGTFKAPSLQDAQNDPGYQFTAQQGNKGILQGAAAAGGAISGGTLKALSGYNSGLANSTYNDVFNRSMGTFNAGLATHQAQLQDYGAKLQGNQQEFNQLFSPTQLGAQEANSLNGTLSQQGENIANLYTNQGNARAAGIIGSNNASTSGWQGALNSFTSPQTLGALASLFGGGAGFGSGTVGSGSSYTGIGGGGDFGSGVGNLGSIPGLPKPNVPPPYVGPPPSQRIG